MNFPPLSVIVLNWNGHDFLRKCLSSLEKQTFHDFEALVVDNASTDGSTKLVGAQFPWVRLLILDQNYGFCGGNNRGIAEAKGRYVVLLNNDTECDPGFLKALFEAAEAHPDAGQFASRMLRYSDRSRIDNLGIGLRAFGTGYPIRAGQKIGGAEDGAKYVFGACAGAALYRRSLLEEIGLLDEAYFSHGEDTDLAWRAQLAGYRCLHVPQAIVYHLGGASSHPLDRQGLYRIQRNLTWTFLKNMPTSLLIALFPLHLLYSLYWLFRAAREGKGAIVWKAKWDALRGWHSLLAKRRAIQAKRRLSTFSLLRYIDWGGI